MQEKLADSDNLTLSVQEDEVPTVFRKVQDRLCSPGASSTATPGLRRLCLEWKLGLGTTVLSLGKPLFLSWH